MNRQSLKEAQSALDEVLARIVGMQLCGMLPMAETLEEWHSRLSHARFELTVVEASIFPEYMVDMRGVVCGGE